MTIRIAFQKVDGTLEIIIAAPKEALLPLIGKRSPDGRLTLSDDEYRDHVYSRSLPADATNVHELPDSWAAPDSDRTYRDAWVTDGKTVSVDMDKAKKIHRDRLRSARVPLLTALDVDYIRAVETSDATAIADVVSEKQSLRDITADPAIDAALTPDDLRAAWPVVLQAPQRVELTSAKAAIGVSNDRI